MTKSIYCNYYIEVECCKREQFQALPVSGFRPVKGDILISYNGIEMEVLHVKYSTGQEHGSHFNSPQLYVYLGIPSYLGVSEKEFSEMVEEKRRSRK